MRLDRRAIDPADHERQHMELDIGNARAGHIDETAAFHDVGSQQTRPERHVLRHVPDRGEALVLPVERDRVARVALDIGFQVVLEIAADAGKLGNDLDAVRFQMRGVADPRELQQARRLDRAGAQDDLARSADGRSILKDDACRATALERHFRDARFGHDLQISARLGLPQECVRSGPAAAVMRRRLVEADAFLLGAVEIWVVTDADLLRRADEGAAERVMEAGLRYAKLAFGAMVLVGDLHIAFEVAEDREYVAIAPAAIAVLRPRVVVVRLAADIQHGVDRGAAADHVALQHDVLAAVQLVGLLAGIGDDIDAFLDDLEEGGGNLDPTIVVPAAAFDQQDLHAGVFAQARGDDTTGRAAADDDVVELFHRGTLS